MPLEPVGGDSVGVVNSYNQAGIHPDILWQDAGWYPDEQGPFSGDLLWLNTGTWEPDPIRYPNGFTDMSAQINALGVKFMLWFEPERVGNTNSSFSRNQQSVHGCCPALLPRSGQFSTKEIRERSIGSRTISAALSAQTEWGGIGKI